MNTILSINPCNTIGAVRPSIAPPSLSTPTATSPNIFGGLRRPSGRPKFPPRTRPTPRTEDSISEEGSVNKAPNSDRDLISLIPIDRTAADKNEIDDKPESDNDGRVLTGGPFIANFGGGGRPGRPVGKDDKEKNSGRGSATLQKVKYCRIGNNKMLPISKYSICSAIPKIQTELHKSI